MRFSELGRPQSIIKEGIRNWNGLLCASIVGMLPMGVRDVFVQAAVAVEELEQDVRSLFLYSDGSASMSSGWPKEPALASWSVIVWAQCRSRMIPLFAVAAPVELDWELVAERKTLERFQRSLCGALGHSFFVRFSRVHRVASDCQER